MDRQHGYTRSMAISAVASGAAGYTDYPEFDRSDAGAGLHGGPRAIVETAA